MKVALPAQYTQMNLVVASLLFIPPVRNKVTRFLSSKARLPEGIWGAIEKEKFQGFANQLLSNCEPRKSYIPGGTTNLVRKNRAISVN